MNHPYIDLEKTPLWKTINAAIKDLEKNRDIELTTAQQYVIGYICKKLVKKNLVTPQAAKKSDSKK